MSTDTTTFETVQAAATEAGRHFETRERTGNVGERYTTLKDGRPEWLLDLVREAHGGMLPDDWRYSTIRAAVDAIAEHGDDFDADQFADNETDTYTGERLEWAASHSYRLAYADEAREQFGPAPTIADDLGRGQFLEAREIADQVLQGFEALVG